MRALANFHLAFSWVVAVAIVVVTLAGNKTENEKSIALHLASVGQRSPFGCPTTTPTPTRHSPWHPLHLLPIGLVLYLLCHCCFCCH